MNRILVTGASGFVGRRLLYQLLQSRMTVRATSRHIPSSPIEGVAEWLKLDLMDEDSYLRDLCRDCYAVIHLAGQAHDFGANATSCDITNRRVTRRLAQAAAAAGVQRFVYLSTVKVYGEGQDRAYTESDPAAPEDAYARSKLAAEQVLQEACQTSAMDFTIIRSPLIYGPGVKANFLALLRLVNTGLPLPLGSIRNRRSFIYVDNLCDLLFSVINAPAAVDRIYSVADLTLSTPDLIRSMARALGTRTMVFPCPPGLLRMLGSMCGRRATVARLTESLMIDDSAVRRDLDWKPPIPAATAMQRTADWFLGGGSMGRGLRINI
jgi:nucleoside-diphosphate-sugar epimerase